MGRFAEPVTLEPEPVVSEGAPQSFALMPEQSRERPLTSVRRGHRQKVALVAGAVVLAVAIGVGGLFSLRYNVGTGEPPVPVVPELPVDYPGGCGITTSGTLSNGYVLGVDRFRTLIDAIVIGDIATCVASDPTHLKATYQISEDDQFWAINYYIEWLVDYAGFTVGHVDDAGGELWRRSFESGQWLHLEIVSTADEVTVAIVKGGREVVPDELISATVDRPDSVAAWMPGESGRLTFTPAPGWQQYAVSYASGYSGLEASWLR